MGIEDIKQVAVASPKRSRRIGSQDMIRARCRSDATRPDSPRFARIRRCGNREVFAGGLPLMTTATPTAFALYGFRYAVSCRRLGLVIAEGAALAADEDELHVRRDAQRLAGRISADRATWLNRRSSVTRWIWRSRQKPVESIRSPASA